MILPVTNWHGVPFVRPQHVNQEINMMKAGIYCYFNVQYCLNYEYYILRFNPLQDGGKITNSDILTTCLDLLSFPAVHRPFSDISIHYPILILAFIKNHLSCIWLHYFITNSLEKCFCFSKAHRITELYIYIYIYIYIYNLFGQA